MYHGSEPMCIGVESDSHSSRPCGVEDPGAEVLGLADDRASSDMRNSTPAISLAIAWNAPPSTRIVIGSISTRSRVGRSGVRAHLVGRRPTCVFFLLLYGGRESAVAGGADGRALGASLDPDHDVPEAVDLGASARAGSLWSCRTG